MSHLKKNRHAFRPSMSDQQLEERLVMSGATASSALTLSQLRQGYGQQYRSAYTDLKNSVDSQVVKLYANGTPSSQQLTDFSAGVNGALYATALRLSSQDALLPGHNARLLSPLQNALLGSGRGTLATRIGTITLSNRITGSEASLMRALNTQINATSAAGAHQLANYFNTTRFARLSVDSSGNRIPLQQYVGNQIVNQFGNTYATLSNSFASAGATLYANGATPSTSDLSAFSNRYTHALSTASFQLGSDLALFKSASSLAPQLQSAFFATGNDPMTGLPVNSVYNSLQGLFNTTATNTAPVGGVTAQFVSNTPIFTSPNTFTGYTPSTFATAAQNAFGNTFGNVVSPIYNAFGLQTPILGSNGTPNYTLPTTPNSGVIGSQYSANGFSNGFGSGFMGFGQAPSSGFNPTFGNSFNNFVNSTNTNFGLTTPILAGGTGQQFFPLGGNNGIGGNNIGGNTTTGSSNGFGGSNIGGNTTNTTNSGF